CRRLGLRAARGVVALDEPAAAPRGRADSRIRLRRVGGWGGAFRAAAGRDDDSCQRRPALAAANDSAGGGVRAMTIALVVASVALALIAFRGETLLRYLVFEIASDALLFVAPHEAIIAIAVLKLAAFSVVLARGVDVRWSATRAAAIAAIVYAFIIPTQMQTPIDGDEPFYLLITESLVHDHDLDLRNQYATLAKSA